MDEISKKLDLVYQKTECLMDNLDKRFDSLEEKLREAIKISSHTNGILSGIGKKENSHKPPFIFSTCIYCGNNTEMIEVKSYVRDRGGNLVCNDIPAYECQECGGMTYTEESIKKITNTNFEKQ